MVETSPSRRDAAYGMVAGVGDVECAIAAHRQMGRRVKGSRGAPAVGKATASAGQRLNVPIGGDPSDRGCIAALTHVDGAVGTESDAERL